uniref:Monodehydroascorbate reductase n=1 Tax=Tanacetum cinerariifolium TaxID=118510 RepID=A0A699IM78_TANCI|nr:hypothetical protein [Tanacetum cinerariifolium]
MDMTIDQQVALDEALVPHARRLRIGRSNFCLLSDISSKESTLQLVYDVLRQTPFFKAFLVTEDVPEIYMQEFWATVIVHHHSIRFKMDNKKHIVNLESFREMLHICPRLPGQTFDEPQFEEEILALLRFLGHSGAIRRLTDVNINKLHQPWRSFAAIINKCLSGKSLGYDSLRLSQAQFLWGFYHKRNVDFAYLLWEDFVYQVEHKDTKQSNEMYYPRFTKVIIHHFMSKDLSIPRRNKVNWHYVRDDHMFTTIKLVSRHQNTQQFSAMLPIELTNAKIRNSDAYKEYYAVATGATPPKTKASVWKTKSSSDTTVTPLLTDVADTRLFTSAKGKQPAITSKAKSLTTLSEVAMTEAQQLNLATKRSLQQTHISQASGSGDDGDDEEGNDEDDDDDQENANKDDDEEGDDDDDQEEGSDDEQASDEEGEEFIHLSLSTHDKEETRDEESFDHIPKTPENTDDEGNGEENLGINVGREEGQDEEDEEDELYRDVNINLGRGVQMDDVHTTQEFKDSHATLTLTTSQMDVQTPTSVALLHVSTPTLTPSTIATLTTVQQAPTPPTTALSTLLQDIPNFGSLFGFDHRLKTLEAKFSEYMQTNQFAGAVSSIPKIVQRYMDQRMNEAVKVAVQIQSDRLRDEAQAENDEFLKIIDENMHTIIKDKVKEQVKVQVFKILPKIEQTVNEQLKAEVLTRSSSSSKTSYAVAADLSKMELKKILIEKIEGNKRRDDDADKDEEPSAGSDRGSKRRREGKEPESASAPKEKATRSTSKSTQGSKSRQTSTSKSATAEEPMQTTYEMEEPSHPEFETGVNDQPMAEPSQHPKLESACDVYSKRRIITVTKLKIVEWHNYKHLDWITVHRDDDKPYKFKEGDFNRLRIQDIEDMLLLLVQGKLTNLAVEERFAFNVSLRMFTRSIVIQSRVEDLQLGVESYQKKLKLTSDGTLTDVRTALDDHLKGIRMKYLPRTIWRKSDKDRAAAMIQAIDKQLKTRRIMRSLERFVGGRLYEGDFRMLQRTI